MPKRSYEQFSSPRMLLSKLNTTSISITDLPVDVICLVFGHLPLAEVLRKQALVCKAFYDAHLQHCRSSVKHLTLFGHYMLKEYRHSVVEPQKEAFRKQVLFEYARKTNGGNCSFTPTINPSSSHLKLVVGLEESAYAAIGTKFQSVTSLELFQPALERHYRPITAMINAWGGGGGEKKKKKKGTGSGDISTNQLTELKIFFNKEIYRPDGLHIKSGNSSCCLAYLLAEALTPDKAPALRRLTIVPGNWRVTCQNSGNHNSYRGPLLAMINLSQERRGGGPFTGLRELTIKTSNDPTEIFSWATAAADVLGRLTGLTVIITYDGMDSLKALPTGLAANLRRLSLRHVQWSLTKVVQQVVPPLTTTTTTTTTTTSHRTVEGVNDRLEELRVDFFSSGGLISLAKKR
ncbi:hypothetical protein TYRP_020921 [Tyrophagus putrescentiae]|nr:hypothetical protein TYRP_020921 [Tyrophagus putrescentiae]